MASPLSVNGDNVDNAAVIDSLQHRLSEVTTAADSISLMYDIFDLSSHSGRAPVAQKMLALAQRSGDTAVALDMIRQLANTYYKSPDSLNRYMRLLSTFPTSDDRSATQTFLELRQAERISRHADETSRRELLRTTVNDWNKNTDDTDPYRRVSQLGQICIILGNDRHQPLVIEYLDKVLNEVEKLPRNDFAVHNIIYNQAINVFTNIDIPDRAVGLDKNMLQIMQNMETSYHARGRKYRNFDSNRFITYRNMIQNYEGMTAEEVREAYDSIQSLARRNPDVKQTLSHDLTEAYYMMATGEYAKAIKLFKEYLATASPDNFNRMRLLGSIIKAAKKIDDKPTLLEYTIEYNEQLEKFISDGVAETYNELLTFFNVEDLQVRNTRLELENLYDQMRHQRLLIIASIVIFIVMAVVIFILIKVVRKSRKLAGNLTESNTALEQERASLLDTRQALVFARDEARSAEQRKTKFIENMSDDITRPLEAIVEYSNLIADCADSDKQKFLRRYADIVKVNTEILSTTVHDLLQVRLLENPHLTTKQQPTDLEQLCTVAVDKIKPQLQPGVDINFIKPYKSDTVIITDGERVSTVIEQLLSNAAKFTPSGSITLTYEVNQKDHLITFAVTDTGIGVPPGKEEVIFDRFYKLQSDERGSGLGLTICRMIADLLHGTVTLDRSHNGKGSRFLFTIPITDLIFE